MCHIYIHKALRQTTISTVIIRRLPSYVLLLTSNIKIEEKKMRIRHTCQMYVLIIYQAHTVTFFYISCFHRLWLRYYIRFILLLLLSSLVINTLFAHKIKDAG